MHSPESIRRSVDALERVYAVVVALAITLAIQAALFADDGSLRHVFTIHDSRKQVHALIHQRKR